METPINSSTTQPVEPIDPHDFQVVVTAEKGVGNASFREAFAYRDMIFTMVHRDFVAGYKQTLLGPAWSIVQAIISTVIFAFTFGNIAGLSPSGIPIFLFYMMGQVAWNYFRSALSSISNTFLSAAHIMGKVYFPRLVIPIVRILSNSISFIIQTVLFIGFYLWFHFVGGSTVAPGPTIVLVPFYLIHLVALALGSGMLLSSVTTKYRDTTILIGYFISLWMYLTPILYDSQIVPSRFETIYKLNPLTPIFVHLQSAIFGRDLFMWPQYALSVAITIVLLVLGKHAFGRVSRNFIDII